MKSSLLLSFFFFTIILQASWCLASESSNGEKLATLPRPQAVQATTDRDVGGLQGAHIQSAHYLQGFNKVDEMEITDKHRGGGEGAGGSGNGNGNENGQQGSGTGENANGAESDHQGKKKHNNAPSLGYPWIGMLLGFGVYTIMSFSSFMI
ncbi:uncharacterized protein LOC144565802 isoform X2 [Carex rostrata]